MVLFYKRPELGGDLITGQLTYLLTLTIKRTPVRRIPGPGPKETKIAEIPMPLPCYIWPLSPPPVCTSKPKNTNKKQIGRPLLSASRRGDGHRRGEEEEARPDLLRRAGGRARPPRRHLRDALLHPVPAAVAQGGGDGGGGGDLSQEQRRRRPGPQPHRARGRHREQPQLRRVPVRRRGDGGAVPRGGRGPVGGARGGDRTARDADDRRRR